MKRIKCDHRQGLGCEILEKNCLFIDKDHCTFRNYYGLLTEHDDEHIIAQRIKDEALDDFRKRWRKQASNKKAGNMKLTGGAIEQSLRKVLQKELKPLKVHIHDGEKEFRVYEGVDAMVDCLIEKKGYATTIISVKTLFEAREIRETFAMAYLAKTSHGLNGIRVYMVAFAPRKGKRALRRLTSLSKAFQPYLDGIYHICQEDYVDSLVKQLGWIYGGERRL